MLTIDMKIADMEISADDVPIISDDVNFERISQNPYPENMKQILSIKR
jgi:hypothetical protein